MGRSGNKPLPAEVDEVRARIERWRHQRKGLGPMPGNLWSEAAELAQRFGINAICRHMGLNYTALKSHLDPGQSPRLQASKPTSKSASKATSKTASKATPKPVPKAPIFVELGVDTALGAAQAGPVLEVTSPSGVRILLHLPAGNSADLATLMTALLACHG